MFSPKKEQHNAFYRNLDDNVISEKCFISYPTVNSHISHIYEKLHVKTGTEAVAKAIQRKLVDV